MFGLSQVVDKVASSTSGNGVVAAKLESSSAPPVSLQHPPLCGLPKGDSAPCGGRDLFTAAFEVVKMKSTESLAPLWKRREPGKLCLEAAAPIWKSWIILQTSAFEDVTSREKFPTMFSAHSCPVACNYSIPSRGGGNSVVSTSALISCCQSPQTP